MHKTLVGLFPILLVVFEAGFRFILGMSTVEFIGPTLCIAGLSFLVPLTRVKTRQVVASGSNVTAGYYDSEFVSFVLLSLLIFLFLWGTSFYLSVKKPDLSVLSIPIHAIIGAVLYGMSVVLTVVKEKP